MGKFSYLARKPEQHGLGFDLSDPGELDFTSLTEGDIFVILQAIWAGEPVDPSLAVYATTHNPEVLKWMPGDGHWCAKNED